MNERPLARPTSTSIAALDTAKRSAAIGSSAIPQARAKSLAVPSGRMPRLVDDFDLPTAGNHQLDAVERCPARKSRGVAAFPRHAHLDLIALVTNGADSGTHIVAQ